MKRQIILLLISILLLTSIAYAESATPTDLEELVIIEEDILPIEEESVIEIIEEVIIARIPPSVIIWRESKSSFCIGETVTLYSYVENNDNWTLRYQWESGYNNNFSAILGANDPTYTFYATKDSLSKSYRLIIYYK